MQLKNPSGLSKEYCGTSTSSVLGTLFTAQHAHKYSCEPLIGRKTVEAVSINIVGAIDLDVSASDRTVSGNSLKLLLSSYEAALCWGV
jgi:hypothetical protein